MADSAKFCTNCGHERDEAPAFLEDLDRTCPTGHEPFGQPVQSDYQYPTTSAPLSQPQNKAASVTLSIFLGILLFAFVSCLVALAIVRPSNLPKAAAGAEIAWILDDAGVSEMVCNELRWISSISNSGFEYAPTRGFAKAFNRIDSDDLSALLRKRSVKTELGNVVGLYVDALAKGRWNYQISTKELINALKAIAPDVRDEFGYKLSNDDYKSLTKYVNAFRLPEEGRMDVLLGDAEGIVYVLTTAFPSLIFGLLILLSVFNIFILHRKNFQALFLNLGFPVAISGVIFVAIWLAVGPLCFALGRDAEILFSRYLPWVVKMFLLAGLIALAVGIVLIICSVLANMAAARLGSRRAAEAPQFGGFQAILIVVATNVILVVSCGIVALIILNLINEV
jgi:hypothetical protein